MATVEVDRTIGIGCNEIAIAEWRLRRVHRAELGETRNRIVEAAARDPKSEIDLARKFTPGVLPGILRKRTTGIVHLESAVEGAIAELIDKGTISRETCDYLDQLFGDGTDNPTLWLKMWFFDEMPDSLRKLEKESAPLPEGAKPDKKAAALENLELCLRNLERQKRKVRKQEKVRGEIELQRLCIPNDAQLGHLQRYETAIKRDRYRSIDLLERLQRQRRV